SPPPQFDSSFLAGAASNGASAGSPGGAAPTGVQMISDHSILRKIGQQPKQSAGMKELVRELGVRGEDRRGFAERLDQLVRRGECQIVRVLGRPHATVVGTFHYGSRYNYVTPMDEKITLDIVIPRGAGKPFAIEVTEEKKNKRERHRVLGTEARRREVMEDLE